MKKFILVLVAIFPWGLVTLFLFGGAIEQRAVEMAKNEMFSAETVVPHTQEIKEGSNPLGYGDLSPVYIEYCHSLMSEHGIVDAWKRAEQRGVECYWMYHENGDRITLNYE